MIALADPSRRLLTDSKAELARRRLRDFVRYAWHVVEPATPLVWNWHIDAICEHLEAVTNGQIKRLLINVPFRTSKSTLTSVMWPSWTWINDPSHQWLCGSYAEKLAIRDSLKMRRVVTSPWYRRNWGDRFDLASDQNQKLRFENDKAGYRIAFGMTGGVMGDGGDTVLIDDPHDRNQAHSELERESALVTFDEAIITRLNVPAESAIVIIMQRLHDNDLAGHVLKRQGGWEHLMIPMEFETERKCVTSLGWEDPRTEEGELMWPERFDADTVANLKQSLGPYASSGQLQQRPSPSGGGIFKKQYFRYFRDEGDWYTVIERNGYERKILKADCWRFSTVDTAWTTKTTSDYTVRQVWDVERVRREDGTLVGGAMLLVDQFRDRVTAPEVEDELRTTLTRWQPLFIGMEVISDGATIYQRLVRDGLAVRRVEYGTSQRIPDKRTKAVLAEVWMSNGKVYFQKGAEYLDVLETELLNFPLADHDDCADNVFMAVHFANNRDLWQEPERKPFKKGTLGAIAGHDEAFADEPELADPFKRR